jgi:hypothetical protein
MRTTIELPDPLYRQVKAQAALEGVPMKALVRRLVERGMAAPAEPPIPSARSSLPTLSIGRPLAAGDLSNAGLFELADEGDA